MTHPIDMVLAGASNTLGSDYWVAFDEAFMEMCSEMVVIRLEGWERQRYPAGNCLLHRAQEADPIYGPT